MNHSTTLSTILLQAARAKTGEIAEQLSAVTGNTVMHGPFKGMKLPTASSWGDGDICPKLLGTYEQELHVSIETCIARNPEIVYNIGCAEGYYAVGLARRLPMACVRAYDKDSAAQAICFQAADINSIFGRLDVYGRFDIKADFIRRARREKAVYVIDVEGYENSLFGDISIDAFRQSDLIVECHDFIHPGVTENLRKLLETTHAVEVIREGPRDPSGFTVLENLPTLERYLAICEYRPVRMQWIVAFSKERG